MSDPAEVTAWCTGHCRRPTVFVLNFDSTGVRFGTYGGTS